MISTNRNRVQCPDSVDCSDGIRTVSNEIAAAQDGVVTGVFCTLGAGFKRFDVGMDVAEDEIAHGV
jgi:hypothetical protein